MQDKLILKFPFSGACMSIVSAAIQLCKTVRDLAYDMMTSHHRDRLRMCIDAVDRVTSQMGELLNKRSSGNKFPAKGGHLDISPNSTPGHLANLFHQRRLYDRSPESPPSDRFSELLREQCVQSGTPPEKAKQDNGLSADLSPTPGEAIAQSRAFPAREAEEESSHITGNSGSIDGSSDRDSGHSSASRWPRLQYSLLGTRSPLFCHNGAHHNSDKLLLKHNEYWVYFENWISLPWCVLYR